MAQPPPSARRLSAVLLGTAVGDSLGLPAEGLSRARIARRWPGALRHRLVLGRGMVSDDTEHTFLVAQALLAEPQDAEAFQRRLAGMMRWWLLGGPAGVGATTLRAILRLWRGIPASRSGLFSAGNGPAMRSAVIGARFWDDPVRLRAFVTASTTITHTDPRADVAAQAVAIGTAWALGPAGDPAPLLAELAGLSADPEWARAVQAIAAGLEAGQPVCAVADALGCERGISGYAWHTVPVALYAWLRHRGDFRATLTAVVACGGDTDTAAAIAGALAGASGAAIPVDWVAGIVDWPLTPALLSALGGRLATAWSGARAGPMPWAWAGLLVRNPLFLAVVVAHGVRRIFPPY